eukprot:5259358-Prymnesium_polylepis.1
MPRRNCSHWLLIYGLRRHAAGRAAAAGHRGAVCAPAADCWHGRATHVRGAGLGLRRARPGGGRGVPRRGRRGATSAHVAAAGCVRGRPGGEGGAVRTELVRRRPRAARGAAAHAGAERAAAPRRCCSAAQQQPAARLLRAALQRVVPLPAGARARRRPAAPGRARPLLHRAARASRAGDVELQLLLAAQAAGGAVRAGDGGDAALRQPVWRRLGAVAPPAAARPAAAPSASRRPLRRARVAGRVRQPDGGVPHDAARVQPVEPRGRGAPGRGGALGGACRGAHGGGAADGAREWLRGAHGGRGAPALAPLARLPSGGPSR